MIYDVIIIGAGPGGIYSALELNRLQPSLKVAVLSTAKNWKNGTVRSTGKISRPVYTAHLARS